MLTKNLTFSKIIEFIDANINAVATDEADIQECSEDTLLQGKNYSAYSMGNSETLVMTDNVTISQFVEQNSFTGVQADNILNINHGVPIMYLRINNKWYKINIERGVC